MPKILSALKTFRHKFSGPGKANSDSRSMDQDQRAVQQHQQMTQKAHELFEDKVKRESGEGRDVSAI